MGFEGDYRSLLRDILNKGVYKQDRTGVGTISRSGMRVRHDLDKGFPLLTAKSVHYKSVFHELLWMISGDTNIKYLQENGVTIWDEWADENGDLGPVYGHQWKHGYQLHNAIDTLKNDPHSRRIIVNSWNVDDLESMALPPCHYAYQFVVEGNRLNTIVSQRSADMFLGVPFNMAGYALLTHMVAAQTRFKPGIVTLNFGDAHIYTNHVEQVNTYLSRPYHRAPDLTLTEGLTIDDYKYEHIHLSNYNPLPAIPAPVAV